MNTISQSEILLQDANNEVGAFLRKYQVSDILKQCNGYKQKGFSVIQLFAYLVTLMFQPISIYMAARRCLQRTVLQEYDPPILQ